MSSFGFSNIVTDGLVFYLDAANKKSYSGSGTDVFDISSKSNNGSLINGTSVINNSFLLDGVNDYINLNFGPEVPIGSNPRTLCAFIKIYSYSAMEIFGFGNNSYPGGRTSLWFNGGEFIGVEACNAANWTSDWPGINKWVYLCAVLEPGNDRVDDFKIYVNGYQKITSDVNGYVLVDNTAAEFLIGTIPQSIGSCNFQGEIGCIKVYNKAITDLEVLQNYNALKSRFI